MASRIIALLFTDIEGSSRLWDQDPDRMRLAVERHNALAERAVSTHRGTIDGTAGDSMLALFDDPLDAVRAAVAFQQSLRAIEQETGIPLRVRCGVHAGADERNGAAFFGRDGNRGARVMGAAHGGQILLTHAAAELIVHRLPRDVWLVDLGAVRLRDLSRPERVHQVAAPTLPDRFPPLRGLEAAPNNIPFQLTPLIGRDAELDALSEELADARLLTLLGPGGIGKTRLALQLAANEIDRFGDGVFFVDLSPVDDAALIPQAVASAVGVKEESNRSTRDSVHAHLQARRVLLVLDNCEHLIADCAVFVQELLQASLDTVVCATSREPLRVAGEVTYAVPALGTPPPNARDSEAIARFDAVRLFVDRARRAHPAFRLTMENAHAIAEIVRRLDGIPLAVELAAARVRTLGPQAIAARLQDRFKLLTHGDRTALPRRQTLAALIGWSYDLLTQAERALFRRLAVFAGSWDLQAAEALACATGLQRVDGLETLGGLVDKSLVMSDPESSRYRMLESIAQFAKEELEKAAETTQARDAHLVHFQGVARRARPELGGREQGQVMRELDLDRDNLLAAQAWCDVAESGVRAGLELAHDIKLYWFKRGLLHIGCRFTELAVARAHGAATVERSRGLFDAGQFCSYMGQYHKARMYLEESLDIARKLDDRGRIAAALQPLGLAALGDGDVTAARGYLDEALALARAKGDPQFIAGAASLLAMLHRLDSDFVSAEWLYREVLQIAESLGDSESIAIAQVSLAIVAIERGDTPRASRFLTSALELAEKTGSRAAGQCVLEIAVALAASQGNWHAAAQLYGAAERTARESGSQRDPADARFLARWVERSRESLGVESFADAEREGGSFDYAEAIATIPSLVLHSKLPGISPV